MSASIHHLEPSVDIAELAASAPGTAYVRGVVAEEATTTVLLGYPGGRTVSVVLPVVPEAVIEGDEPARTLAVHVRVGNDVECAVLSSTSHGARRIPVGLPVALRLAADGVHTVFKS